MTRSGTKIATVIGATGSVATGSTFAGITAGLSGPVANLGGYATAQIVAGSLGGSFAGPVLATGISIIGGPLVAGTVCALGVGGLLYGGVKLVSRLW